VSNLFNIEGKFAVVTGASSGLGRQFALALAREGANVAILARRIDRLEQVKAEVEALGVKCISVKCDVADNESIKNAVSEIMNAFGRIDILVNNAGIGTGAPAEMMDENTWDSTIRINLSGVYYVAREVGKIMIEQNTAKSSISAQFIQLLQWREAPFPHIVQARVALKCLQRLLLTNGQNIILPLTQSVPHTLRVK